MSCFSSRHKSLSIACISWRKHWFAPAFKNFHERWYAIYAVKKISIKSNTDKTRTWYSKTNYVHIINSYSAHAPQHARGIDQNKITHAPRFLHRPSVRVVTITFLGWASRDCVSEPVPHMAQPILLATVDAHPVQVALYWISNRAWTSLPVT